MKTWILMLLIAALTIIVWYKTLGQTFTGEGYYYFDINQQFISTQYGIIIKDLQLADNFARLLFDILFPVARDNFSIYFAFQLFVLIALNITLFYLVTFFTKNKTIGFIAALLFLPSYTGLFEMVGIGNYQRFAQRVPNIIPMLMAIVFLARYFQDKQLKQYLISLVLFTLGVFMGHFSSFLLPLFVLYPVVWAMIQKPKITIIMKNLLLVSPFIIVNLLLTQYDHLRPARGVIEFIHTTGVIILAKQMILQIGNLLLPPVLIKSIAAVAQPYTDTIMILSLPIIVVYVLGIILVKKSSLNIQALYLTSLLFIPILLFLNLYLGKVDPAYNMQGYTYYFLPQYLAQKTDIIHEVRGDRYYFLPALFIAIASSILLWSIIKPTKGRIGQLGLAMLLIFYFIYNTSIIYRGIEKLEPLSGVTRNYLGYIHSLSGNFSNDTIIVTQRSLSWPSPMIRALHKYPDMQFVLFKENWEGEIKHHDKQHIFIIDYDWEQNRIIDLTQQYRDGEQNLLPKSY